MAGEDLLASLYQTDYAPIETGWGVMAQGVGSALPALVNPYGSAGSNIAMTLGGALVAGLLGYQARSEAEQRNVAQAQFLPELFAQTTTPERRAEIFAVEPRLAKVYKGLQLQQALAGITAAQTRATEEMKADVEAQKQRAIDLGISYKEAGEPTTPTEIIMSEGGGYSYLGKKGEADLTEAQKTFANSDASKNYIYTKEVLQRLAPAIVNTHAVVDVDFAKGAIQGIEPKLATQQGEVDAINKSPSIPESLRAMMANAAEGKGRLTPKMRAQIVGILERAYTSQADSYKEGLNFYANEAITKARRPELAEEIRERISASGPVQSYEDVVQKWFKVPGAENLGEYRASDLIANIASGDLDPEALIRGLSVKMPTPEAKAADLGVVPVAVMEAPAQGSTIAQALSPTSTPGAVVSAPQAAQPRAVVEPSSTMLSKVGTVPTPPQFTRVQAETQLKGLLAKGKENWTPSERRLYTDLFSLFGGR